MKHPTYGNEKLLPTKKEIGKMKASILMFRFRYYQLLSIKLLTDNSFNCFKLGCFFRILISIFIAYKMNKLSKCLICDRTVNEDEEANNLCKESITAIVNASIKRDNGKWNNTQETVLPQVVHRKCKKDYSRKSVSRGCFTYTGISKCVQSIA